MEPSLNIRSFRIGNLVYNPHLERIGYIAEITRADMTLFHGEMLIKEAGFYHEILDKVVLGDVRPIRLTPTLLEKCGFEKEFSDCYQRFDYYIIPRVICLSPKKEGFCWQVEDEIDDCNVDVPIKYLHQLQNIYFTLTGTELNVENSQSRLWLRWLPYHRCIWMLCPNPSSRNCPLHGIRYSA